MGLAFTNIRDTSGAAIYIIYDGTITQQRLVERLAAEISSKDDTRQVVVLSARDRQAERIRDFYDLSTGSFPHVLLIADDDRIMHAWAGPHIPMADHVVHTANTIG